MTSIYVVRHGETLLNSLGKAQGWCDSPLTLQGQSVAREMANAISNVKFDAAYCSDTLRAAQTASIILDEMGLDSVPLVSDSRVREWCLGDMEAEQNSTFTKEVSSWLGDISSFSDLNLRLPEVAEAIYDHDTTGMAETFNQITKRLNDFVVAIANSKSASKERNILLVTHAFTIKTLFHMYSPDKLQEVEKIGNASVFRLRYADNKFGFE